MKKYKLIDLFAGAGGLSQGFEQTGKFEVIGAVEINKEAIQTYIHNHNNDKTLIIKPKESSISDISKIKFEEYIKEKQINSDEVVIIGGPPCQGFSNANRQKNYLISGNNQLVKEFARAIHEVKPIAFLMENVKTMNSETHKFFVTNPKNLSEDYSSENHLIKVFKDKYGGNVKEEILNIIEFEDLKYRELVDELIINDVQPVLVDSVLISRVRGVVRKLKSTKKAVIKVKKDLIELSLVIEKLKNFELPSLNNSSLLQEVLMDAISIFESLKDETLINDDEALKKLSPFLKINQMLRYLKELEDENIFCLTKPKTELVNEKMFILSVKVKTYNIVEYLKAFFDYLDYDIDPGVVKSNEFFVPQKRERYMILGVRKLDTRTKVKLPKSYVENEEYFTVKDAIEDLEKIAPNKNIDDPPLEYNSEKQTKMKRYYRDLDDKLIFNHVNTDSESLSLERFKYINEFGGKNFHSLPEELKAITYANSNRTQNTVYLRLNYDAPSPTVINVRKSMWQHPLKIRAISIREAARLQSFKDNYIFKGTKDKQYQQIGNAVPPLLARAVAESMLYALGETPKNLLKNEFN